MNLSFSTLLILEKEPSEASVERPVPEVIASIPAPAIPWPAPSDRLLTYILEDGFNYTFFYDDGSIQN